MNFDRWRHGLRGAFFTLLRQRTRAIEAYRESLRADPGHLGTLRTLGWLEAQREQWAAAERLLRHVVELAPEDAHGWFNLGYVCDKGGMDEQAVGALLRATALDPNNDRAWYGLGLVHARNGRHREAAEALTEAGRLQPMNNLAWYALGMAWQHCNEPDKVAAVIEHTLVHDPQTARRLIQDCGRSDFAHRLG
ncbi:MAG: tetratricopeptide repeat protein [Pseudomonadota bacterium]